MAELLHNMDDTLNNTSFEAFLVIFGLELWPLVHLQFGGKEVRGNIKWWFPDGT